MSGPFRLALIGATATSTIAVSDALNTGFTGHGMLETASATEMLVVDLIHGFTYIALTAVLVGAAGLVDQGNRFRRWVRRLLAGCLAVMVGFFTIGSSVRTLTQAEPSAVLEGIGTGVFLAMFVLSIALGVATLRIPAVRASSMLLTALLPVIPLTVLLGCSTPASRILGTARHW